MDFNGDSCPFANQNFKKMRLYRKEKHWSDYWEVQINFPWVGRRKELGPDEPHYVYGFSFPTECFLHREDDNWKLRKPYWYFTLKIFGFGVTITRQDGY